MSKNVEIKLTYLNVRLSLRLGLCVVWGRFEAVWGELPIGVVPPFRRSSGYFAGAWAHHKGFLRRLNPCQFRRNICWHCENDINVGIVFLATNTSYKVPYRNCTLPFDLFYLFRLFLIHSLLLHSLNVEFKVILSLELYFITSAGQALEYCNDEAYKWHVRRR